MDKLFSDPIRQARHERMRARMSEAAKLRWAKHREAKSREARKLGIKEVRDYYAPLGISIVRARDGAGPGGWSDWLAVDVMDRSKSIERATAEQLIRAIASEWGYTEGLERFNVSARDPFEGLGL